MRLFQRLDQRGRFGAGATLCLLLTLLMGVGAPAQGDPKRVLLLYDEDTRLPGLSILDRSLRSRFSAALGSNVEFFTESLNVSQFNSARDEQVLSEYYSEKYRDKQPDLIMAVIGPALGFLLRHADEAFPGVPIVFCGADAADIQRVTLPSRVTGILVRRVFAPTIDVVLRLQPDTHRVVVVGGTSAFDRHLLAQARNEFQQFEPRVAFEYLVDLPMSDLLAAVSRLPARTVVVFLTLFRDGAGRTYVPHDVVSQISAAANAPVYVFVDQYLGRGAVGGHLYSLEQHGTTAAEIGLRVLQGDAPATIPVRELPSTANMFDARELDRWRLDERRLPADSVVMYREPDFFDRYKSYIVGGGALLVAQTAMIAGLLFQRRRRRRAERELRNSYERISNLGGRLLNAQDAERAHLARELHDDIGQQMVLLQMELQALMNTCEEMSSRDAVSDVATRATAIGTSVHDLSHRLHPSQLRLVGLTGALGTLVRQLSTNRVSVVFSHETVPASLSEELTVCLYRVAQEALNNAIKHGRADKISVSLRGTPGSVHMSINDNGVGFDSRTAPAGVGLISMTERVEHAGGSLQIRSQPGGGTDVDVRVPCGEQGTLATEDTDTSTGSGAVVFAGPTRSVNALKRG
jgi:signal transduction histidine kinase